jgi:hypothetical protein
VARPFSLWLNLARCLPRFPQIVCSAEENDGLKTILEEFSTERREVLHSARLRLRVRRETKKELNLLEGAGLEAGLFSCPTPSPLIRVVQFDQRASFRARAPRPRPFQANELAFQQSSCLLSGQDGRSRTAHRNCRNVRCPFPSSQQALREACPSLVRLPSLTPNLVLPGRILSLAKVYCRLSELVRLRVSDPDHLETRLSASIIHPD